MKYATLITVPSSFESLYFRPLYMVPKNHIIEIDILRGIAIVFMVLFHIVFDLNFFFGFTQFVYNNGFWFFEGRLSAILFIVVSGMSTSLLHTKYEGIQLWRKGLRRFMNIFFYALLITIATWYFAPTYIILFGILHFLAISALLALLFTRFSWVNIILGILIVTSQLWISGIIVDYPYLIPLGIQPFGYQTFDYYPLIPWFGLILIGVGLGNMLYPKNRFQSRLHVHGKLANILSYAGKKSLLIYLIHQPIILLILSLFFGVPHIL